MADRRGSILQLLKGYQPLDDHDREQAHRLTEFIQIHPECFERTLLSGHITGSAWVVDGSHKRVLLTHHKKLNKWLQLGGHADGEPDILQVALREAKEESGLSNIRPLSSDIFDLDVHAIPARAGEPAHYHYDIRFLFEAGDSTPFVVSDESINLAWIEIDRVRDVSVEESLLRMVRKWKNQRSRYARPSVAR